MTGNKSQYQNSRDMNDPQHRDEDNRHPLGNQVEHVSWPGTGDRKAPAEKPADHHGKNDHAHQRKRHEQTDDLHAPQNQHESAIDQQPDPPCHLGFIVLMASVYMPQSVGAVFEHTQIKTCLGVGRGIGRKCVDRSLAGQQFVWTAHLWRRNFDQSARQCMHRRMRLEGDRTTTGQKHLFAVEQPCHGRLIPANRLANLDVNHVRGGQIVAIEVLAIGDQRRVLGFQSNQSRNQR